MNSVCCLQVQARNLTKEWSKTERFYCDFEDLAKSAGHEIDWTDAGYSQRRLPREVEDPIETRDYKMERLLLVPDVTESQHTEIYYRICAGDKYASEEDHLISYRHMYRKAYRLATLDANFISAHGSELDLGRIHQLAEVLYPGMMLDEDCQVNTCTQFATFVCP